MKRKRIFFAMLVICLAGVAGMLYYRKNVSLSPEETVKKQLDVILKENTSEKEEDDLDLAALFMDKLQKTRLACAMSEPSEHQEEFFENIVMGLQKIHYEVTVVSQSDSSAEVSISINYFKLPEIIQNAQQILSVELKDAKSFSTEEIVNKHYEVVAQEFQKGPSDDSKTAVSVTLHKNKQKWETDSDFADKIFDAILQTD